MDSSTQSHRILRAPKIAQLEPPDQVVASARGSRNYWEIFPNDARVRLISFPAGERIRSHRHLKGPLLKTLIFGQIRYGDQVLRAGELAWVDGGVEYDGVAEVDSLLVLIEPSQSNKSISSREHSEPTAR